MIFYQIVADFFYSVGLGLGKTDSPKAKFSEKYQQWKDIFYHWGRSAVAEKTGYMSCQLLFIFQGILISNFKCCHHNCSWSVWICGDPLKFKLHCHEIPSV